MRTPTIPARAAAALAAVSAAVAVAACFTATPGVPAESLVPPVDVRIDFAELSLTMTVPGRFGEGELGRRDRAECTQEQYAWRLIPSDAGEPGELLFVATTDHACPDQDAVNGRFPTWDNASQLPDGTRPVGTPVGEGHGFSLDYTQCTNECHTFPYDVTFVELPGGGSFWVQASGIDDAELDAIVGSLRTA
ncbi:MAG: hypothetical protein ACRDQB_09245 [Thermocrispum sp.]